MEPQTGVESLSHDAIEPTQEAKKKASGSYKRMATTANWHQSYLFNNLNQVRQLAAEWIDDYNEYHPHKSLNGKSPLEYMKENELHHILNSKESSLREPVKLFTQICWTLIVMVFKTFSKIRRRSESNSISDFRDAKL